MRAPPQWGQLARWVAAGMLHIRRQLRQRRRIIVILLSAQRPAVLAALVRRDEAEALLVAEPLHGSSCHMSRIPPRDVRALANAEGATKQRRGRWALLLPGSVPGLACGT